MSPPDEQRLRRPAFRRSPARRLTAMLVGLGLLLAGACGPSRQGAGDGTFGERVADAAEGRQRDPAAPNASDADSDDTSREPRSPDETSTQATPAPLPDRIVEAMETDSDGPSGPAPTADVPAQRSRGRSEIPDPTTLQAGVIALGDEIIDVVVVATDLIEDETDDVDRRRRAHEVKLAIGRSVVNTVAGPSSFAALVDLVVKSSLLARAAEISAPARFGEQAPILIEAIQHARDEAWETAARLMIESQLADLETSVAALPLPVPDLVFVAQISLREYVASYQQGLTDRQRGASFNILSLLRIDPLANLDPTTRELEQSRLLGERALYQAQRTGRLLRWEVEGLLYDLLAAPETQNLLRSADRASRASETLASTVEALPATVADQRIALIDELDALVERQRTGLVEDAAAAVARERAAAIDDLRAAVAAEREALREDVAAVEGPLVRTMESTRATIEEATRMSGSLDETLATFDQVLRRMGVDRTQPREPRDPDRPPFDVAVYGSVATDIGAAARDLATTLESFESVLNEPLLKPADRAGESATDAGGRDGDGGSRVRVPAAIALEETGRTLLDALLLRAAILVIVAGLTAIGAAWVIRRMGRSPA